MDDVTKKANIIRDEVFDRLKYFMQLKNISPYQLANDAMIESATIYGWFNKKQQPNFESLSKVCAVLGITLEDLFCIHDYVKVDHTMKESFEAYKILTPNNKAIIDYLIVALNSNREIEFKISK